MTSRRFSFTSFNPDAFKAWTPDPEKVQYVVFQNEMCPDTHREHVQGYVELKSPSRFTAIKKMFGDDAMHLAPSRGDEKSNTAYCTKDAHGLSEEDHFCVIYGEPGTQGARSDIRGYVQSIIAHKRDRELVEEHPVEFVKYPRVRHEVRAAYAERRTSAPEVVIIWGPTGTGKSHAAFELAGEDAFVKAPGDLRWWDGYTTGQNIVIDEFRDSWGPLGVLLRLLDKYPLVLEVS